MWDLSFERINPTNKFYGKITSPIWYTTHDTRRAARGVRMAEAMPEIPPAKIMDKRKMPRMIPKAMNFPFIGESAFLSKAVKLVFAVFPVVCMR